MTSGVSAGPDWASGLLFGTTVNVFPLRLCTAGLRTGGVVSTTMSSMFVIGSLSTGGSFGDGTDLTGEQIEGGETGAGEVGVAGGVCCGDPVLASMVTFSVSFGVKGMKEGGKEVGTAGSEAATPTRGRGDGGERTGLDGAVLPGDEMAARLLGMTVKELRDWRRKLASARACRSPGGRRERSGRGDGRISKLGDKGGDVGLGVQSARARWLSGEHGTLALEAPSVLSQSRSLTGLDGDLSVSSLGYTVTLRPTLPSKRLRVEDTN